MGDKTLLEGILDECTVSSMTAVQILGGESILKFEKNRRHQNTAEKLRCIAVDVEGAFVEGFSFFRQARDRDCGEVCAPQRNVRGMFQGAADIKLSGLKNITTMLQLWCVVGKEALSEVLDKVQVARNCIAAAKLNNLAPRQSVLGPRQQGSTMEYVGSRAF